jgi:hypothetical protein
MLQHLDAPNTMPRGFFLSELSTQKNPESMAENKAASKTEIGSNIRMQSAIQKKNMRQACCVLEFRQVLGLSKNFRFQFWVDSTVPSFFFFYIYM